MSVSDRLKFSTRPLQTLDLDTFEEALGESMQEVWDLVATGSNGEVGWSVLLDPKRCPDKYLPWLAQVAGVLTTRPGETFEHLRARIIDAERWGRGTPDQLYHEAIRLGLTRFLLQERTPGGNAWSVRFLFTIDEYGVEKEAVLAGYLPAGIVHDVGYWEGVLYQDSINLDQTYSERLTRWPTYSDVNVP
jgi:hypothetical protein